MYRVTGKSVWQELGWDMFDAIVNGTKTALGTHASVRDVTQKVSIWAQEDYMEVCISDLRLNGPTDCFI